MKPNQKEIVSENFFTKKIKLEDELLLFEEIQKKATEHLTIVQKLADELIQISENNSSAYFLQRSKRLSSEIHKLSLKKEYHQKDFDPLYHILSKIKSEDKIEFLNSSLINRINRIATNLSESKNSTGSLNKVGKKVFISYQLEGVHFLIPKFSYRIIHEIPAFKNRIKTKNKIIPLFPGPGFGISNEKNSKKSILVLKVNSKTEHGFYFDRLGEDWAISVAALESLVKKDTSNENIIGKLRKKGILYHIVKV